VTQHVVNRATAARNIREKVAELARARGIRSLSFSDDDVIPEQNLLDSAAIMELIVWYEDHFGVVIDQADVTIENFGTVNAMVEYLTRQ
jgi:D-alanine--poly(phosphoribitol) ligase subunit 2